MNGLITFFQSILEVSLFASAMIVVVLLIRKFAKDRINIKVVSFLWLLVIARLCLPGMLESPVHTDALFPASVEMRQIDEQSVTQNSSTNLYQNNIEDHSLTDNEVITPSTGSNLSQTSPEPQPVAFYEQALAFVKSLDLWLVAAIVWLIGGAIVLASVLKESITFGLRIRRSSQPLDDAEILGIVAAHRRANRLRRNIRVSLCSTIQMPLAFGVWHPHVLLPARMTEELGREHMEAILLHEVCHIKRNDILKSYACVLAKALHWFNPLVWISLKMVRKDMEFACDQRAFSLMKTGQEIKYCESLLMATRFMKQRSVPALVTSLCESKSNLKERILKMVVPQKKSRSAVVISLALAMMMLVACFTTACQPTPENSIVQGKDNALDGIVEKNNTDGGDAYTAPESLQENLELGDGRLQIEINAPIEIPSVYAYPVVRCTPGKFTIDQLNEMIMYFAGDSIVYEDDNYGSMPVSVYDGLETKSEIEAAILQLQLSLSDPNSNINGIKESNPEAYQQAVDSINSQIEMLTERLQTAPETAEQTPLILDNSVMTEGAIGTVDLGKASPARIEINSTDSNDGRNNRFIFENRGSMVGGEPIENIETGLRNPPQLSVEDAMQIAETAVNDLAGNDMQLACTAVAAYDDMLSPIRAESYLDSQQYYVFFFTRSVGGIPYTYQSNLGIGSDKEIGNYFPTYPYEYIQVGVDDTGIIEFIWRSPAEIGEVLTNSATLLSFDEIKDIFEQQIYVQQVWNESTEDTIARKIYIEKITLGMMRVINPDKLNEYLMIPVWDFFGYYADVYPEGYQTDRQIGLNENNEDVHYKFAESMLTINAYNGTIIDRGAGY